MAFTYGTSGIQKPDNTQNPRSGIKFHGKIPAELCGDCQKRDQTRQPSKSLMFKLYEFLSRVHNDLEGSFACTRHGYRYYISFLEESKGLIDIEPLKFKDDVLAAFKNYKALLAKQSGCQLKIIHSDRGGEYMGKFNDCFKKNSISYEATALYLPEQNRKQKELIALSWTMFGRLLLNRSFPSHYGRKSQKR